jgi:tRNA(fMet)-specific endonuclease VapC
VIYLDTDHLTVLFSGRGERFDRLVARLESSNEKHGTTIVCVEEQMRGWLAVLAKERKPERQVLAYRELAALFSRYAKFHVAPFDEAAAKLATSFNRIRIGAMDRKIAAIAMAQNALLLTANRRDFELVPGLRFANWLD